MVKFENEFYDNRKCLLKELSKKDVRNFTELDKLLQDEKCLLQRETNLSIDQIIIKGKLVIANANLNTNICINSSNIEKVEISGTANSINIIYCNIYEFHLCDKAKTANISHNYFCSFISKDGVCDMSDRCIRRNEMDCKFLIKDNCHVPKEEFYFNYRKLKSDVETDEAIVKTIDTLLVNSDIIMNKSNYSKLMFKRMFHNSRNIFARVIICLTGAFYFPALFILYSIGVILVFGLLYFTMSGNSILSSLYYSGITFTTLGYGEIKNIVPSIKVLSVIEALFGIIFCSCFITSLMNKYIK